MGGFNYDQRILMASDKMTRIFRIKPGQKVLGFKRNRLYASRVNKVYNCGIGLKWIKITGDKFQLICTPVHSFKSLDRDSYTKAKNLEVGENLAYVENPELFTLYKVISTTITRIEIIKFYRAYKFDISTDSANYFVEGVLSRTAGFGGR